jgi:CubicO group peptidase (beta-lactamase class C family)
MNKFRTRLANTFVAIMLMLALNPATVAAADYTGLPGVIENGMELWHVPGMSVAVVSSDEVLYQQGFGETAIDEGQKVDEHTLFAIASTTKAMVVSGILMLVDEKKLSLDDPIVRYLPELHFSDPMLTEQLMVRDLLAHRTGLPSTDFWGFFQEMPLDEQIRRLEYIQAAAPLRTRLIYQNTMFELAGLLIERLSGKPWDLFIKERLWQPIGMNETVAARGQIEDNQVYVMPYHFRDEELVLAEWDILMDLAEAAGSVWSSIHDMSLWAQFLLRDGVTADGTRLISEAGMAEMFKPHQLASPPDFYPTVQLTKPNWISYGLAWFQQDFQGRKIDFHTGSLSGLIAIIGLDRAGDRAVVVLGNRDHAEMRHAVLWEVMDDSPPDDRRDWNQEIFDLYTQLSKQQDEAWTEKEKGRLRGTKTSLAPDDYSGDYESPGFGKIRIENSDGEYMLKMKAADFAMSHWHLDTFLVEHWPWEIREFAEFRIGPDGSVSSVELFGERFEPVNDSAENGD